MRCCPTSTRPASAAACSSSCSGPGQVAVKDYYAELPIAIKVSGRYHDIGSFAADVANLSRIVTLHNLNIVASREGRRPGMLSMEATARTYRYLDPPRSKQMRKADAAKAKAGSRRNERAASCERAPLAAAGCRCRALAGCAANRTSCSSGWSSRGARSSRASQPLSPPKKFDPAAVRRAQRRRALQHAEADGRPQAGSAAAEFAAGGRDQPAQGAARGLSARQHGDGRQRRPKQAARTRCCGSTTCCTR